MSLATKVPSQIEWYTKRIAFKHSIFISHSVLAVLNNSTQIQVGAVKRLIIFRFINLGVLSPGLKKIGAFLK